MTVDELLQRCMALSPDERGLEAYTEGCDCVGDIDGICVLLLTATERIVLLYRSDGETRRALDRTKKTEDVVA